VILDRSSIWRGDCSLLSVLLFALPLDHDAVPNVQSVSPVNWVHLLVLATVTGKLPSVGDAIICYAVLKLLPLHPTAIDHHAAASPYPPPEPRLILERDIFWW
jgi:hypothetical protein